MKKDSSINIVKKLESDKLLKDVEAISEHFYSKVGGMGWAEGTRTGNMRTSVQYMIWYSARGVANDNPAHAFYDWLEVKKNAFAFKKVAISGDDREIFQLSDKSMAKKLDLIIVKSDKLAKKASTKSKKLYDLEIKNYKKKIDLWSKAQK